jgi:hypothetical protein
LGSTVFALTNILAAMPLFVSPSAASCAVCLSVGVEVAGACRVATRCSFGAGALGPELGADILEDAERRRKGITLRNEPLRDRLHAEKLRAGCSQEDSTAPDTN